MTVPDSLKDTRLSLEEGLAVLKVRKAALEERIKRREEAVAMIKADEAAIDEIVRMQVVGHVFCTNPDNHWHRFKHFLGLSDLKTVVGRAWESGVKTCKEQPWPQ